MNESPGASQPSGDDRFFFRRRTTDEAADLHRQGRRLTEEARVGRGQWLAVQARMALTRHTLDRRQPVEAMDAGRLLQEERVAHGLSKMALERELARSRRLEDEVLSIQDQERARLARELHDGIAQNLVAITLLLEIHLRQLRDLEIDPKPMQSGLKLAEIFDQTIQELRELSHGLSGIETGARGENLCDALRALAGRINASGGVHCAVVCPEEPVLGQANATHLYRIVQEAVGNAVRHGKAARIEIDLVRVGGQGRLTVTDDGVGVPENAVADSSGLGMRSIRYRAAVIGGTLEVRRARPAGDRPGTVVRCTFP